MDTTIRKKVVRFADTVSLEYTLSSDFERAGTEWQLAALDRLRFRKRISQVAEILNPILLKKLSCISGPNDCIKGPGIVDYSSLASEQDRENEEQD